MSRGGAATVAVAFTLVGASLAGLPAAAAAQSAAQSAAPAASRTTAQTAADSAAVTLLERASRAYQGARTLRADFAQRLYNPRTRTDLRARGEFLQKGATLFAFRFAEPSEDRIVSDGESLWLYAPSTARGQVLKMPRAAGATMDLAQGVLREPARRYSITAMGDTTLDGRAVRMIRLVPRGQATAFTTGLLWVDAGNALVRRAEFTEPSGLVRTLEFTNIRTGVTLPRDAFRFTPPAGVRVVDQAALLGGSSRPPDR